MFRRKIIIYKENEWNSLDCWITCRGDPNASEGIRMDLVAQELTTPTIVNVNTSRETMVNVATDNGRVGFRTDFDTSYPVAVYIVLLIVAL